MKARCNSKKPGDYGAKGISYDPEWQSFDAFLRDMGERPAGMTLDRINPEWGYCKRNCRWATPAMQTHNRSNTDIVHGRFGSGSPAQWARDLNAMTGSKEWNARALRSCLRVMSIDQIIAGIHPLGISARELEQRISLAKRTERQKANDAYFDDLLARTIY